MARKQDNPDISYLKGLSDREKARELVEELRKKEDCDEALCLWLIAAGADMKAREYYTGYAPLTVAAVEGRLKIAEAMLDAGANVNRREEQKMTALMWAVQNENQDMVRLLVKRGASVNLRNEALDSALNIAQNKGRSDIAYLLIRNGANENVLTKAERRGIEDYVRTIFKDAASQGTSKTRKIIRPKVTP
ncbi:MAG: ankyrin repeat domain-containing protein [Alphaproteobacteria bacterium]|nr:ankyrin repeat domain-containing protein [Alphaproteobacteria bacterium]